VYVDADQVTGTTKTKTKSRRKKSAPALSLWSSTIASTEGLLDGLRFAAVAPTAEQFARADEEVRERLEALAAPIRPEAFARTIR
jgi:hypothetical protein